jgi:hypothetical protein
MSTEEMIELDDGSAEFPDLEAVESVQQTEFLANLAEVFDPQESRDLAGDLCELIEKDRESRKKRDEQYEEGLRRSGLGNDAPGGAEFEGASKVVHPVLAEACVDFSARAIKELFPATGPVRRQQFTDALPPDVIERADRKVEYMNWQLTTQMQEYRPSLEQLLTQLPMGGSQFQKFWYDDRFKRPRVEFVPVDEILLPYSATCFYTATRATHRQLINKYEFAERVKSGLYRDIFLGSSGSTPDQSDTAKANEKIEGKEDAGYNEDGLRAILEVYTWQSIPEDELSQGAYAPYIITIDEDTEECLAIYRNWSENDPLLAKLDWIVEWVFIPWRGAYGIGLPHLIGGLSAALTGALRALLDSAHINNAATMLKLRSGRVVGQNTSVSVTQVCDIEGPAGIDDIRKLAMPMPFNPPSPVLANLMTELYGLAKGVVATADEKINQIGDRTPVGTTMSLIEQGSVTYSAIHSRLHGSQKKALEILHRIDATFLPAADPQNPNPGVITKELFQGSTDVIPVSDPSIFSEAQRFAQTQAMVQMAADQSVQWNKIALYKRALKQMRVDNPDEILPPIPQPVTADASTENTAAMSGSQLQANPQQDHYSHIIGHLTFISSPIQLQNPLASGQGLMNIANHIGQHIQMMESAMTMQTAQQLMQSLMQAYQTQMQSLQAAQMQGISVIGQGPMQPAPDQVMAQAITQVQQQLAQQLGPVLQQLTQVMPEIQKKVPQPPMPPEIQASLQIAQMENDRKTKMDQATLANKQSEQQIDQQLESAKLQMDQQQQQFDQMVEKITLQSDRALESQKLAMDAQAQSIENQLRMQNDQLVQEVELIKNKADNDQKQMTELLKNRDDNETKKIIEQMKAELTTFAQSQAPKEGEAKPSADFTPQLQQMTDMLGQIRDEKLNTSLSTIMESLHATMAHMSAPTELVRGPDGKAVGMRKILN